jgi:hypothetical protein
MDLQGPDLERMKFYVYRRPLHPELFSIFLDKRIDTGQFEAELWLIGTGHLISFHRGVLTLSEVLTSREELLPEKGMLEAMPVDRAREYQVNYEDQIHYMLNIQSERMSDAVFASVHEEMTKFAQARGMFMRFEQWAAEGQLPPFSFIDYERRPSELDVFTYHAFPDRKVMLRTQSIFSLGPIEPDPRRMPEGPFRSKGP